MPSAVHRLRVATPAERWSLANAGVVLGAVGPAVWWPSPWPVVAAGAAMLLALAGLSRSRWTPSGAFGAANLTTAVRLAGLCTLPLLSPTGIAITGTLILIADGLDGWLARRYNLSSEFGEFFDKETDALFLLALCLLAVLRADAPTVLIGAGLLRYGFVFALFLLQPHEGKEQRSSAARIIYVGTVLTVLAAFVLPPPVALPFLAAGGAALLVSFGRSFIWLVRA